MMNSFSCFFYLKDVFFLNKRSKLSVGKGEKCSFFSKIAFGTQPSFCSQNSLSKKIECLGVLSLLKPMFGSHNNFWKYIQTEP